jgi:type III pantothenate kinase
LKFQGPVIGRNTKEAMSSAVCVGYPGMLDSLLDAIEVELGEKAHVVITGGDAQTLAPAMRHKCIHVPALTLVGTACAAHINL